MAVTHTKKNWLKEAAPTDINLPKGFQGQYSLKVLKVFKVATRPQSSVLS